MRRIDCDLVIFDCDGVLIDSEMISYRILQEQLAEAGIAIDFDYFHNACLGRSFPKVAGDIRINFGIDLPPSFEERYRQKLIEGFERDLRVVDGVEGVLAALSARFCVATSSSPTRIRRSLEVAKLAHWFGDRVFTASQVAHGKPAPDLFLFVAERMGVAPSRCLVIEDSLPGVEAALAANMQVLRFVGASHLTGIWRSASGVTAGVQVFDKWANFFEMAPQLRRPREVVG